MTRFIKLLGQEEVELIQEHIDPKKEFENVNLQNVYDDIMRAQLNDIKALDHDSLLHMLNSMTQAKNLKTIEPIKLTGDELSIIESLVLKNFHTFIGSDITIPISAIFQNGGNPETVLRQLNKMVNLSIFGKSQCFRLLEAII